MTDRIKEAHEKAVWPRDPVTGRMLPVARPQDPDAHGKRGEACKGWGIGYTKDEIGPRCKCKEAGK